MAGLVGAAMTLAGAAVSAVPRDGTSGARGTSKVVMATQARVDEVNRALSLAQSSVQRLTIDAAPDGSLATTVEIDGVPVTLALRKHTLRADGFQVLVQSEANGPLVPVEPPPIRTYRGSIVDQPGSRISASYVDGTLTGTILTAKGIYSIQSVESVGLGGTRGEHVIHRAVDWVNTQGYRCGTVGQPVALGGESDVSGGVAVAGTGLQVTDIAADADFEFFQRNGSSVENTVHDIENVLEGVELIYERDTDISYEVTTIMGFPSTGFPVGFSSGGLPLGAQIFGAPFQDHRTIAAVHQLEKSGAVKAKIAPFEG